MAIQRYMPRMLLLAGMVSLAGAGAEARGNDPASFAPSPPVATSSSILVSDQVVGESPTDSSAREGLHQVSYLLGGGKSGCDGKGPCDGGKGGPCGCEKTAALNKAAAGAYKGVFFDNNFDYLCDPCYDDWHLGENLKRLGMGDWITVDVGGQYRFRQHSERNIRNWAGVPNALGLTGVDDDFILQRTRLYVNTEIGNRVRVYAEMLDATSDLENFRPRPIEENRVDIQNLFLDVVALDGYRGSLTVRYGRQELLYGNQRTVSPLDWANTRRTFEGAMVLWEGQNWDIDAFWVRPMRRDRERLDAPNQDREMYGLYSTYKGLCRDKVELYWLALDYRDIGFLYDMLGARYWGGRGSWLYEFEGAVQFGKNADGSDHSAGACTLGLGRKFECAWWQPTLWAYYDWASGSPNGNGYHHYEPLAHKYLGFMDLYARRNIQSANFLLTMQPHKKLKLLVWYYFLWLDNINDVPYNVNMTPFANLAPGSAGSRDLGQELDVILSSPLTERLTVLFGYSHFFAGEFYSTTAGVPYDGDADFFYTQLQLNF